MDDEAVDPATFKKISPSRFVSFSFPNPSPGPYAHLLRVAVLDSPRLFSSPSPPRIAAILVPRGRESDWIFSTAAGHLQLLLSSSFFSPDLHLSRLILICDSPPISAAGSSSSPTAYSRRPDFDEKSDPGLLHRFQDALFPLLLALCPKASFETGSLPNIPFLLYEDDVIRSVQVERIEGPVVGEMLVEDVEIDSAAAALVLPDLRRRLRFRRMPNLVQSQVRLIPDSARGKGERTFRPEHTTLLQPYLSPMVAGLSLLAPSVDEKLRLGLRPRALCLGVGAGALLMFLQSKLDFDVTGVEADLVVLEIARRHFGLVEGEFLRVHIGDGIRFTENFALQVAMSRDSPGKQQQLHLLFDVIMVDLDASNAINGISAPPIEFLQKRVLLAAQMILHEKGIAVVNVIAQGETFYGEVVQAFRDVFAELFEIELNNGENYVIIASALPFHLVPSDRCGSWFENLKQVTGETYISSIRKI